MPNSRGRGGRGARGGRGGRGRGNSHSTGANRNTGFNATNTNTNQDASNNASHGWPNRTFLVPAAPAAMHDQRIEPTLSRPSDHWRGPSSTSMNSFRGRGRGRGRGDINSRGRGRGNNNSRGRGRGGNSNFEAGDRRHHPQSRAVSNPALHANGSSRVPPLVRQLLSDRDRLNQSLDQIINAPRDASRDVRQARRLARGLNPFRDDDDYEADAGEEGTVPFQPRNNNRNRRNDRFNQARRDEERFGPSSQYPPLSGADMVIDRGDGQNVPESARVRWTGTPSRRTASVEDIPDNMSFVEEDEAMHDAGNYAWQPSQAPPTTSLAFGQPSPAFAFPNVFANTSPVANISTAGTPTSTAAVDYQAIVQQVVQALLPAIQNEISGTMQQVANKVQLSLKSEVTRVQDLQSQAIELHGQAQELNGQVQELNSQAREVLKKIQSTSQWSTKHFEDLRIAAVALGQAASDFDDKLAKERSYSAEEEDDSYSDEQEECSSNAEQEQESSNTEDDEELLAVEEDSTSRGDFAKAPFLTSVFGKPVHVVDLRHPSAKSWTVAPGTYAIFSPTMPNLSNWRKEGGLPNLYLRVESASTHDITRLPLPSAGSTISQQTPAGPSVTGTTHLAAMSSNTGETSSSNVSLHSASSGTPAPASANTSTSAEPSRDANTPFVASTSAKKSYETHQLAGQKRSGDDDDAPASPKRARVNYEADVETPPATIHDLLFPQRNVFAEYEERQKLEQEAKEDVAPVMNEHRKVAAVPAQPTESFTARQEQTPLAESNNAHQNPVASDQTTRRSRENIAATSPVIDRGNLLPPDFSNEDFSKECSQALAKVKSIYQSRYSKSGRGSISPPSRVASPATSSRAYRQPSTPFSASTSRVIGSKVHKPQRSSLASKKPDDLAKRLLREQMEGTTFQDDDEEL